MICDIRVIYLMTGRKRQMWGNGRGFVCVSVLVWLDCHKLVFSWKKKNRLPPYHVETRSAFQPAKQPTHSFIWINLTLEGSLPANSALHALSVSLSLQYTMFLAWAQKCVHPAMAQNEWRSTQTFRSINSITPDTSYRGSSQTSGNRTITELNGLGCQATEERVGAKDVRVWFAIANMGRNKGVVNWEIKQQN